MKGLAAGVTKFALEKAIPRGIEAITKRVVRSEEVSAAFKGKKKRTGSGLEVIEKDFVRSHQTATEAVAGIKRYLQEIASDKKKSIIVLVDELDRCRPDYAIEFLECIKHFYSVDGYVFVLAVDEQQLRNSVAAVFGSGSNASGYLRRFIDWNFRLPPPPPHEFARILYKRFSLADKFEASDDILKGGSVFVSTFGTVASLFDLSLRDQEQCFTEVNAAVRSLAPREVPLSAPLALLTALKSSDADFYERFCQGEIGYEGVTQHLESNGRTDRIKPDEFEWTKLVVLLCDIAEYERLTAKIESITKQKNDGTGNLANLEKELRFWGRAHSIYKNWDFHYGFVGRNRLAALVYEMLERTETVL